ncbi:hypothetical protein Tco_1253825 [Tanacetum coccineum]
MRVRDSEFQAMEDLRVGSSDGVNKNKVDTSKSVSVKRRRTSSKNNSTSLVLETRSSPKTFYNSISTLKPNQKACLEQIGFGNFVEFKVDGILSKLGLYVVDKFDAKKMELKLAEGSLKITKNLISEMLGIRNEGIDIMAEEGKRNEEMVSSWMKQYGNKKDITPGDIKLRIRKSNSADMNFKLNFIVLFTSVMGQIKTKGICNLKILDYISPDIDMANINWCEYVLRCLKSCKEEWTKGKKNCFFRGPLIFLIRPPTLVWTSKLLREREEEELNSGGFGFSEIKGPFVEQEDLMPDNIEKLNRHVNSIIKEKSGFEKTLDAAKIMFPRNLDGFFERYVDALKYQGCRKEGSGNANIADSNRDADAQADSVEAMIGEGVISLGDEHANTGMDQEANEMVDKLLNDNMFGSSSLYNMGPKTQEEVLRSVDAVDAEIERRKLFDMSDIPSFSLGLTQEYPHLDQLAVTPVATRQEPTLAKEVSNPVPLRPVPLRVCRPVTAVGQLRRAKDKRPVTISEVRKSPFIG